jgi:hypothetical protein
MNQQTYRLVLLLAMLVSIYSMSLLSQSHPTAPFIEEGVCPYEFGCDFTKWVSLIRTPLFTNDSDTISIAYWMDRGDSLTFNHGNMHVDQIGVAIVVYPTEGYAVGDTIYPLSYQGEGYYDVWYKGRIRSIHRFWHNETEPNNPFRSACLVVPQRVTWWVSLTNNKRQTGWLPLTNACPTSGACFGEKVVKMISKYSDGF